MFVCTQSKICFSKLYFVSKQLGNIYKNEQFFSKYYTKSVVTAFRCDIFRFFEAC